MITTSSTIEAVVDFVFFPPGSAASFLPDFAPVALLACADSRLS